MEGFANYKDKIKRYFTFSHGELNNLIITVLVIGFIISFKDWVITPDGGLNTLLTIRNIINGILVAALVLLIHESAHRLWAIGIGFRVEAKLWWPGLIAGIILTFATRGWVWFIIAPAIFIHHLPVHRLGRFRHGLNMFANGMICLAGVVATIAFAFVVKILLVYAPANILLLKTLHVSLWFAVINMLPIPPLDGSRIFYMPGGPLIYAYSFFTVLGLAIFLAIPITEVWMILLLLLGGTIVGILGWFYVLQNIMK